MNNNDIVRKCITDYEPLREQMMHKDLRRQGPDAHCKEKIEKHKNQFHNQVHTEKPMEKDDNACLTRAG